MGGLRRKVFIWAYNSRYPGFEKWYNRLREDEHRDKGELIKYQERKLSELLRFCYENVPYYTEKFNELDLEPNDIKGLHDLQRLPILTKMDIRKEPSAFVPKGADKGTYIEKHTGGSTGVPLLFRQSTEDVGLSWASLYTMWGRSGYELGDKVAIFGGTSLIPQGRQKLKESLKGLMIRHMFISSFHMSRERTEQIVRQLNNYRPMYMYGYASALYLFSKHVHDNRMTLRFHPKALFSTAEVLHGYQREAIENVLGCKVFDMYGLNDGGVGAGECTEHSGMHIDMTRSILEITDDKGRHLNMGGEGKILATSLHNYSMPFIRYDTGDMGVLSPAPCECGRTLPLIERIVGRSTDYILMKGGDTVPGTALVHLFRLFPNVQQYQIVQKERGKVMLRIVKGPEYSESDEAGIRREFAENLSGLGISFQYLEEIEMGASGKWKFIERECVG